MVSGHLGTTTPKCPPKLNIGQMDRDGWTYGVAMDGWLDGPPPSTRHVSAQVMCAPTWLTSHYCSVTGMPCHAMPCHSILHHARVSCHAPHGIMPCHADGIMPCHACAMSCPRCHAHSVMPCPHGTILNHAIPCHAMMETKTDA